MDCEEALRRVPDAPRSARKVLCALADRGPLTMKDLQVASGLARRTVYGAITRLRKSGVISEQTSLRDARQTWFWVAG